MIHLCPLCESRSTEIESEFLAVNVHFAQDIVSTEEQLISRLAYCFFSEKKYRLFTKLPSFENTIIELRSCDTRFRSKMNG